MPKGRHARRRGERPDERLPTDPDGGDFAEEHSSTTFADDMPGGPEGKPEPETPSGEGGPGGMDPKSSPKR
ncbi:hypothetical protein [Haloactinopolyspora sp.]|uniref:hypothetical protein n=1 Tax=Haloactinopolyspora sp. TaxID=1966353 RepID=UPI00260A30A5|nr:hypothetical protein [Haloactinopolyspora sp.]